MQRMNRRWLSGVVVALAVGCGGGSSGGDDDGTPDGGTGCKTVCFRWSEDDPPPPAEGQPVKVVYDECNPFGLRSGVCPQGFTCGGTETFQTAMRSVMTPVCSPAGAAPYVLDLDLAPAPIPPDAVAVSLALTLNDGAWPDASATQTSAGMFRATSQRDPLLTWTFDIPSRGQSLDFSLPPDTYDVQVTLGDYQGLHYPAQTRRGVLEVIAAGEHVLPFEATLASIEVRLDGAPVGAVTTAHVVTIQLTRVDGTSTSRSFGEGDRASAMFVLRPGTYRRTLLTQSPEYSTFPSGVVKLAGEVSLSPGPVDLPIDAATVLTTGTVSVDGADLPVSVSGGRVSFAAAGYISSRAQISATRPASFRKRLFVGTYDVFYDSTTASLTGIPRGIVQVRDDWAATASLPIAATTLGVTGSVTLNGAALPAGAGGTVSFGSSFGSTTFPLSSAAGGSYTGRIFAGTYNVSIRGTGNPLPDFDVPVGTQWVATTAAQTWQIDAHPLTVTMTQNGQPPPAATTDFERGSLTLEGVLVGRSTLASLTAPASGAMQVSAVVPDGTWTLRYAHIFNSYTGTPLGNFPLGQVQISGGAQAVTRDLRSVWVSGQVLLRGAALPDVVDPRDRGIVSISGLFYGFGGDGGLPRFPATGPAAYGTWLVPGVYDLYYYCINAGCRTRSLPEYVPVYRALRVN